MTFNSISTLSSELFMKEPKKQPILITSLSWVIEWLNFLCNNSLTNFSAHTPKSAKTSIMQGLSLLNIKRLESKEGNWIYYYIQYITVKATDNEVWENI